MVLVYYFCKGSKSLSYFISLVSKSIASNIAYCISTNIYWSSTKCEELWEADRPVTPAQGYYSPVFGANMDTVQGRMTFILIRGIRRYTMEHTFKSAGRIRELHGQYEFEHSQETPRDVTLRQNRKQTFRDKRIYNDPTFKSSSTSTNPTLPFRENPRIPMLFRATLALLLNEPNLYNDTCIPGSCWLMGFNTLLS